MRRTKSSLVLVTAIAMLGLVAVVPVALAGNGKPGGGATSAGGSLVVAMVADRNLNGAPNWGDTIKFNVSTTATLEPHVNVKCTQGGVVVYGASTGYYASYPWPWTQNMTLSSQMWAGGSASCTATLQKYTGTSVSTLATLNFSVGA